MVTPAEVRRSWDAAFQAAAKSRGMRSVGGYVFAEDGAFAAPALDLGRGELTADAADDPAQHVETLLDEVQRLGEEFTASAPDPTRFIDEVRARAGNASPTNRTQLREVLALILADETDSAKAFLEHELANGNRGSFGGPDGSVFQLLLRELG